MTRPMKMSMRHSSHTNNIAYVPVDVVVQNGPGQREPGWTQSDGDAHQSGTGEANQNFELGDEPNLDARTGIVYVEDRRWIHDM